MRSCPHLSFASVVWKLFIYYTITLLQHLKLILAITLLNIACLEEGTLANAKVLLIFLIEGKNSEEKKASPGTRTVVKEMLATVSTISETFKSLDQPLQNMPDPAYQDTMLYFYQEGLKKINAL